MLSSLNIVGRVVRIFVSGLNISPDDSKAFLHDFKAGNSKEAQDILNARKKGVSAIAKYVGFLVCNYTLSLESAYFRL